MRLNLLIGVGAPEVEPHCGRPHIDVQPRSGKKHPGDPRPKMNPVRPIAGEPEHAYIVNSSADQYVPKRVFDTANPDVSGFTSRLCRTPPRNTGVGDESFKAALEELRCGKKY
jgi:hypothetical protein